MAKIGSTIPRNNPRYQIIKMIGHGGMSEVYLATDLQLDIMVAVKEVRTDLKRSDKDGRQIDLNAYVQGLENECDFLKSADHPVLPRTVGIYREQQVYVIMDYIDGEDMSKILRRDGPLSQEQVLECALQICDALRYLQAHNPPIIYRDLKPSNIMWKKDGGFKLIDFGTAIEYQPGKEYAKMGTPGFGAPEQFRQNYFADQRSDVYSLGATMYCLLTGQTPSAELMQKHPVREFNSTVSIGLENVIKKCVQPDPNDRYQSAAELLYALEHYDEEDASFKRKQRGKLRLFIATAALAGVMLVAGAGLLIAKSSLNEQNYEALVAQNTVEDCKQAIGLQKANPKAYLALIELYENSDEGFTEEAKGFIKSTLLSTEGLTMPHDGDYLELCNRIGNLYFNDYNTADGDLGFRLRNATVWYEKVVSAVENDKTKDYDPVMYKMAKNYCEMNKFFEDYFNDNGGSKPIREASAQAMNNMLNTMRSCLDGAKSFSDEYAYMKVVTGDAVCYMLSANAKKLSDLGIDRGEVLSLLDSAYKQVVGVTGVSQTATLKIIDELKLHYPSYYATINNAYDNHSLRVEIKQQKEGTP